MSLLVILLLMVGLVSSFELLKVDTGKWNSINPNRSPSQEPTNYTVIQNPRKSFSRFGIVYYWSGYYKATKSNPRKCVFLKNYPDWPFGENVLPNGTIVTGVEFGCASDQYCRAYKCDTSMTAALIWGSMLLTATVFSVGIIVRHVIITHRQAESPVNQDMEMRGVYVPVVIVSGATSRDQNAPGAING
ncbi:hypothetical protein L5515_006140 [Caenorhabditis briggsae]|uniref:CX domain-containing protein n=1 Tax=Caenorhabditis briggsae TaxID=6238 RepID=A0AAE9F191_CAEBR|nr:hypothetical protein L5515_006140 [Caenorhabditis briggsae]